ncbi:MAG TPA: metallophosphoesterase family protein [Vicinamibacterales bacterium]
MTLAALYDIHANLPALEAVLREIRLAGVDRIVVGGDVVPGPMPRETIACLLARDLRVRVLQGNGDREVLALMRGGDGAAVPEPFRESVRWTARQLGADEERLLAGWPPTLHLPIDGLGDTVFCHATPRNDTEIFTRRTPEERLRPMFDPLNVPLVVCGHTHMQFDRTIGRTRVVNAGSVGMPFQEPGAYWLLLGPGVQLRHTRYDLEEAAARIRATGYPQAEQFAARHVLRPPSEQEMLDAFTRVEGR